MEIVELTGITPMELKYDDFPQEQKDKFLSDLIKAFEKDSKVKVIS